MKKGLKQTTIPGPLVFTTVDCRTTLMKKGLKLYDVIIRFTSSIFHCRTTLMKKGLKHTEATTGQYTRCQLQNDPDEEGIETYLSQFLQ